MVHNGEGSPDARGPHGRPFNARLHEFNKMLAKATFKVENWEEDPFAQQDSGPRLTRAHVRKSFSGDLTGTGNLLYLMTHVSETEATFVGIERVVGNLGGRSGSFVLQHSGTVDGQKATAEWEVLQGSGTAELEGLTGSGGFSSGHADEYEMTLEYEFEETPD